MEDSAAAPRRRQRPPRRPERQQIMLRRGLALGGGLILLILIVLGVKGCLDARANRELSDYARNVTQIVEETDQTSKAFFGKLADPGSLSVTEFIAEVNADRSAMDNYASRVDGLSAPGDMSRAQNALELTYELRGSAMTEIADKMSTALGDAGSAKATAAIARQMQKLLAADALYAAIVRPEIDGVLADNGIEGSDVPPSVFLPEGTKWLEETAVSTALGSVTGSSSAATPGVHGLELAGVSVNGTALGEEAASVAAEETVEVEVEVLNLGESTENGIGVSVSVGGTELEGTIETVGAGETASVSIPLTPTPSGEVTLEVKVDTVPGEEVAENNEESYAVVFE
ncbi:MAG TPA: CARDB domain-containing protein [Solirubrobacterales bacterium]|nr:CARDB domain-containing protein [Solirubrobacterales bacterium]